MKSRTNYAAAMLTLSAAMAWTGSRPLPGAYEVNVYLDLPHLDGMGAAKTVTACIVPADQAPTLGFAVLSENNPLGKCPASNIAVQENELTFEVHCEGKNAAEGFATYQLHEDTFEGRIVMKMGGKNMTMTETQKGKRIGPCASPHS